MVDRHATRTVVLLRESPPASVLFALHRLLGMGLAEIRRRVGTGVPLVDVELFGNDHALVADTLRTAGERPTRPTPR
ncbi:hypothetical protein [Polymorphospora rubra]|uniref:hypothetical protein n=1 Tax=Polymorphospora rubra TaxID=338584 RepID=UPI0033D0F568